ncbi:unnamed protein product, partial [Wuchereria bancrofti]
MKASILMISILMDAFDLLDLDFENIAEADESGYYNGDQLQDAVDSLHKNGESLIKLKLRNLQQLFQHKFYEEVNNESDQMSDYLERLPAGGSQSWSSRSMRERQERHFIGYRRHSYPNIARDFVYRQMDDESSVDEMNSLSNLLRMGLTTRDESPPANVASDPRE